MTLSGYLSDTIGWESVFYIFGSIGVVWFTCWIFLVYEKPQNHPRISAVRHFVNRSTTN